MLTRSANRYLEKEKNFNEIKQIYEVNIDEASAAWKANKRSTGGGCYKYICEHRNENNKKCRKNPIPGESFCSKHNI